MTGEVTKDTLNNAKSISMFKNNETFLELKNLSDNSTFPIYCFENNTATSADDLNFNNLKICKEITSTQSHKFLVVNDLEHKITHIFSSSKEIINEEGISSKAFGFLFKKDNSSNVTTSGKIVNFFYKGFSPEAAKK